MLRLKKLVTMRSKTVYIVLQIAHKRFEVASLEQEAEGICTA